MPKDTAATRKPREKPAPYQRKPKPPTKKDVPRTSAKSIESDKRTNLTLADWLTVVKFVDEHPLLSQERVVEHFRTKKDGALVFTQSALSRKLRNCTELEERSQSNPLALSAKRVRIVTQPDVERALVLWVNHMVENGETVSGPMLREKRKRFESLLKVPDDERLIGDGWLPSFCKTYKIKEHKRHGEAGSVDLEEVERERTRMHELTKKFEPRDRWNFDETALLPK